MSLDKFALLKPWNWERPWTDFVLGDALKSDTVDLVVIPRGFMIATTAGAIKVTTFDGSVVVIPSGAVALGTVLRLRITRLWNTGTAAVGICFVY